MSRLRPWRVPTDPVELEKEARKLGISLAETGASGGGITGMNVYEVQRRIREARTDRRNSWLWIVALLSAGASILSAAAAWTSAVWRCGARPMTAVIAFVLG
jgi:hypothetical protein